MSDNSRQTTHKLEIMELSKTFVFNLYFNCRDEEQRVWAETKREESLKYMRGTMERMSRFSVIAKDQKDLVLLLRGYMHLKNPCTREYNIKRILGKYSNCKRATTGDIVNLLKYFNIDKDVTVTGELPSLNKGKRYDARWVLKINGK
jgi:hypothetical protein